ncbi:cell division protein FtsZ [Photobacterium kishitanii]|uniref:Cell division protein FtsZ n=1 Tax=Photobacterium kishitanii TaxID=318456 RepID=A0A2T3KB00_9GAMM|nr:cell division protein FtsZ [Photobacterium kishitanii]PSU89780.1 cell division protein FtsZ [Photobacterium kishitanii]
MNDFDFENMVINTPVIKVLGVGGGGNNAVKYIMENGLKGVEAYCLNTDVQALKVVYQSGVIPAANLIVLGQKLLNGLGAGTDATIGRKAAEESEERIRSAIDGADMVFIATGMGGGTGTGAAPFIAKIAKEMGVLTTAVVTKPFKFEGAARTRIAEEGIESLKEHVDSLIIIPNEKLTDKNNGFTNLTVQDSYGLVNDVLNIAVTSISDIILSEGVQNVDFSDVRNVMKESGYAIMGVGHGEGKDKAMTALSEAINSPLLDDIDLVNAKGVIISVCAGADFQVSDFEMLGKEIIEIAAPNAITKIGMSQDINMGDELSVTIIATGLQSRNDKKKEKASVPFNLSSMSVENANPTTRNRTSSHTKDNSSPATQKLPPWLRKNVKQK